MSYTEYKDMFERFQVIGKYHMFILDIAGSRKLDKDELIDCRLQIAEKLTNIIDFLDKEYGIIHKNDSELYMNNNFFQHGDLFGFVTLRGYKKIVEELINQEFKDFKYDLHYNNGNYETDNWVEGNKKYYFGYCIQQLEKDSKDTILAKGQKHLLNINKNDLDIEK